MVPFNFAAVVALLLATSTSAVSIRAPESPNTITKRAPCAGNTADSRQKWCDFSIDTDWYREVPDTGDAPGTGRIREYWLELKEAEVSPDGFTRKALTVNGTVPGPTIEADWGDELVIHVTNHLEKEGTSMHWHGMRQNYTNSQDGVVSITQCAQAPGDTFTYRMRATQYGTTWYHSHFSLQAWDGVFGAMVIHGPATANYTEDAGPIVVADWFHESVYTKAREAETIGPPTPQNALINGLNVLGEDGAANQTGSRYELTVQSGSSYRLRLINVAIDNFYKFMIDNHTLTVIAIDLVPVKPFQTKIINLGIAQRYDVIVTADQEAVASDFWMRFIPQAACSTNDMASNIRGIIHYGSSKGTPKTQQYEYVDDCEDMAADLLKPHLEIDVPPEHMYEEKENVGLTFNSEKGALRWTVNSTTLQVQWGDPTVLQIANNDTDFEKSQNLIRLDEKNQWAYLIVETALAVAHPIHLHGHDFHVLAQGTGKYSPSTKLQLKNPPRRDVAMLPGNGFLVMAWETDNPGAWLVHCHIGWHTVQGLAFQFAERISEIPSVIDEDSMRKTCTTWNAFAKEHGIVVDDSGV